MWVKMQHDAQAHQGRAAPLLRALRQAGPPRPAGHAFRRRHQALRLRPRERSLRVGAARVEGDHGRTDGRSLDRDVDPLQ